MRFAISVVSYGFFSTFWKKNLGTESPKSFFCLLCTLFCCCILHPLKLDLKWSSALWIIFTVERYYFNTYLAYTPKGVLLFCKVFFKIYK
jgi:hypothetical protein